MQDTYTFHCDPGHGWLAVPVAELRALGILAQVSRYSYVSKDGQTAYLEEDCDAALMIHAAHLTREHIREEYTNAESFIRDLASLRSMFSD